MTRQQSLALGVALIGTGLLMFRNKSKIANMLNSALPRGYRNNNPLNIRFSQSNNWLGKVLPNTDGVFEQFETMAYGYRASLYLIRKYIRSGQTTVSEIISRWAPANENNTTAYISAVCKYTNFTPGSPIDPDNKKDMCLLAYGMSIVENGLVPTPNMEDIQTGYELLQNS